MGWANALGLIKPSVEIIIIASNAPTLKTVQLLQFVI